MPVLPSEPVGHACLLIASLRGGDGVATRLCANGVCCLSGGDGQQRLASWPCERNHEPLGAPDGFPRGYHRYRNRKSIPGPLPVRPGFRGGGPVPVQVGRQGKGGGGACLSDPARLSTATPGWFLSGG